MEFANTTMMARFLITLVCAEQACLGFLRLAFPMESRRFDVWQRTFPFLARARAAFHEYQDGRLLLCMCISVAFVSLGLFCDGL